MRVTVAVAINTWRQFVRDRIFYVVMLVALFLMAFSYFLSTLTIVENRKILLDFGFAAVSLAGVMTAIFLGMIAMAREVENRVIYSILTKPVSRSAYVVGKFLGSTAVLAAVHVLFALTILLILRLSGEQAPDGYFACMLLIFLENTLVLSVAFLASTVTTSLVATGLSIAVFLIGRSSLGFQTMAEKAVTPEIRLITRGLYYIFPNLERFNIRDVVAYGKTYPDSMVWVALLYMAVYVTMCLAGSCLIFRKRDLP